MELAIEDSDTVAKEKTRGRKQQVVALVHQHLGNASVVFVSDVPKRQALKLETASGEILVPYDLTQVIPDFKL